MARSTKGANAKAAKEQLSAADIDAARGAAFDQFLKSSDPEDVRRLSDDSALNVPAIPTGAISLDVALGIGGIPEGRIIELFGPESSGKTSLSAAIAAQLHKMNPYIGVGFIDAEHASTKQFLESFGCDPRRIAFSQPMSGEQGLAMAEKMIQSDGFGLIIVDSVAALTPQAELDGEMTDLQVGAQARMMAKGLRKISSIAAKHRCAVIFINQLRDKIGGYGNPEMTPGGRALKFYASVRMEVRSAAGDRIQNGKEIIGQRCRVTIRKNKVAPPFKSAEYDLYFGKGIQAGGALLDVCKNLGIITTSGATYTDASTGERIAIGQENVKARIEAEPELAQRLTAAVYATLAANKSAALADLDEDMDADAFEEMAAAPFDPATSDEFVELDADAA